MTIQVGASVAAPVLASAAEWRYLRWREHDHHRPASRDRARRYGNRYGNVKCQEHDDGYGVLVTITMPIEQNILCSVSGLMACISKIFGLDYDGWGSVIQDGSG